MTTWQIRCDLDTRSGRPCMNCVHTQSECRYVHDRFPAQCWRLPGVHMPSRIPAPDSTAPSRRPSRRGLHDRQEVQNSPRSLGARNSPVNDNAPLESPVPTAYQIPPLPRLDQAGSLEGPRPQAMDSESIRPQSSSQPVPALRSYLSSHNTDTLLDSSLSETTRPTSNSYPNPQASYLGESGYMPFLNHEEHVSSTHGGGPVTIKIVQTIDPLSPVLRKSYTELFLKHCFTFCPVLDASLLALPDFETSLALQQSIGLIGSIIQPSLLHGDKPSAYYERARLLIQGGYEPNPLAALVAVILFYWYAAAPPTVISMNGVWWWIGVAVRQAQELGLHREAKVGQTFRPGETIGLRRRIWWTLFVSRLDLGVLVSCLTAKVGEGETYRHLSGKAVHHQPQGL